MYGSPPLARLRSHEAGPCGRVPPSGICRVRFTFLYSSALALLTAFASATPSVSNHMPDSEVRYPVVLLRGSVGEGTKTLAVTNASSNRDTKEMQGIVNGGDFKVLAELVPGENNLSISDGVGEPLAMTLKYKPQTNPYYVRVVWMTDKEGDTDYPTCLEDDPQNYEDKLDAMAKLLQTFTAERMHDEGFGRKTFNLELDEEGKVKVHTLATPEAKEHYYGLGDQTWWREIARWLNREHRDPFVKNLVIAAYTSKDPETGKLSAHTALGGGNLGLFGGASVFSWPDSLADVQPTFMDNAKFDATHVHDDSAGRSTIWGLASTTMGAVLHEMGHAFGLPHCQDGRCIMTRGFDRLNRAFTFVDPPSKRALRGKPFDDNSIAYFAPISASYLQWSRWFQLDEPAIEDQTRPEITFHHDTKKIVVKSEHGVRWIGFWQGDNVSKFKAVAEAGQTEVTVPLEEWKELLGAENLSTVTAMAENGMDSRLKIETR